MFIGIAGPICSGKRTIASYLLSNHNFTRLRLRQPTTTTTTAPRDDVLDFQLTPSITPPPPPLNDIHELSNGVHDIQVNGSEDIWFDSMPEMVDYVTKRWRENFVTVDIWNEKDLEMVIKRPFFLLVSVDAPLTVRYNRYIHRSPPSP